MIFASALTVKIASAHMLLLQQQYQMETDFGLSEVRANSGANLGRPLF